MSSGMQWGRIVVIFLGVKGVGDSVVLKIPVEMYEKSHAFLPFLSSCGVILLLM